VRQVAVPAGITNTTVSNAEAILRAHSLTYTVSPEINNA